MTRRIPSTLCLFFGMALVAALPARGDVRDAGEFFSPDAERDATRLMQQIRERHGKDVVVETVPSLPNVPAASVGGGKARDDFYATEVARRGRQAGVKGIYILISREPTYAYAGVDPDTGAKAFSTKVDRTALREVLVNRFKANDFDGGLLEGLRLIDQRMTAHAGGAVETAAATPVSPEARGASDASAGSSAGGNSSPTPTPKGRSGMGIQGWLCLIIGAFVIFMIVRGIVARRTSQQRYGYGGPNAPGYDPRTGQPMGGPGGYDPRYGPPQGAGGGMGRGILGGLLGGMAGGYLYDQMRGGNDAQASPADPNAMDSQSADPSSSFGGGDFGASDSSSDFGGGDFGGGDFGGGDFGGGGE